MGVDIGAIIQGGTGISEIIAGLIGTSKSQEKVEAHRLTRKDYTVPTSIEEQIEILRRRAQQGLPGEDLISQQIQQGTAQGVAASRESATSAADLLGATTQLFGQQTQNLTDLQIASARQRSLNELDLTRGLGTLGEFQDKAFTYNEAIPWQTRMNELMGIQQSSFDMLTGGIETLAASGANYGSSGEEGFSF